MEKRYKTFKMIEDDSKLALLFNSIMKDLGYVRELCAPIGFYKDESIASFQDEKFCDFCRFEVWMHAVVEHLRLWKDNIDEYFDEYDGSWKYYAAAQRLHCIEEYGGDDDDFLPDGTIKGTNLKDSEYEPYSILRALIDDDCHDIVVDASPKDIEKLCVDMIANSKIDILQGLKKHFGGNIRVFRQNSKGEMVERSVDEHTLDMASWQADTEDNTVRVKAVWSFLYFIIEVLRQCKYNDDNKEALMTVRNCSEYVLQLNLSKADAALKKLKAKGGRK